MNLSARRRIFAGCRSGLGSGPAGLPHLPGPRSSLSTSERLTISAPWLALNVGDPDGPPNYITSNGEALLTEKIPVIAASVEDIPDLTAVAHSTYLDGVLITTGDRVLIKNQNDATQNGIYIVGAPGDPPTRADDDRELQWGVVRVRPKDYHATLTPAQIASGELAPSVNNQTIWVCTAAGQEAGDPPEPTAVTFQSFAEFIGALPTNFNMSLLRDNLTEDGMNLVFATGAADQRAVLGVVIGSDVQAAHATLDELVATEITPLAFQLLERTSATNMRDLLELGSMAVQGSDGVAIYGGSITGLSAPTNPTDAATKGYVDTAISTGLSWKLPVRVCPVGNDDFSMNFVHDATHDGVQLQHGDRILLKDQTDPIENGIFIVEDGGPPTRAPDAATGADLDTAAVFVRRGTTNGKKAFLCTSDDIDPGVTAIVFVPFGV